ncbi:MAG TPA: DUF3619 family protein [Burkholderiaceae bacterium]|nr:DUF3619 family protein [Burkholderiaceae bacterium]
MNRNRTEESIDAFGYRVRQVLNHGTNDLPPRTVQRLSAARSVALGRHREGDPLLALVPATVASSTRERGPWKVRGALLASLLVAAAGIFVIHEWNFARSIAEIAEIDTMILSDDLPIDANVDPGFLKFLKNEEK